MSVLTNLLAFAKVREKLLAKDASSLRKLGKIFRQMDSFDGVKKVDKNEFIIALRELGINLPKADNDVQ